MTKILCLLRDLWRNLCLLRNLWTLLANLAIVYALYTVCRLLFIWFNAGLYPDMTFSHCMELLAAGLIFDSSAICYSNAIIILMYLFPLHWKERAGFYDAARWIFVVVNSICLIANLCDVVYFPFTGKRTTCSVFTEFANEGAGNMVNIFADQIVHNLPLLLAGVLMVAALWAGFRSPKARKGGGSRSENRESRIENREAEIQGLEGSKLRYYAFYLLAFLACGFLCWGMMRGGFTHATRPITISNANKYAENPAEAGAVLNTPFSLIRTMSKKPLVTPEYMSDEEAEALFSPLKNYDKEALFPPQKNSATAADNRKLNVVVLIMESFSKQHSAFFNKTHNENGASGCKEGFTPFLDSLATNCALSFRHSYANGRKSIEGMPSVLSSIPNFVEPFFLTPASMNNLSGLARELSENKGYASAFFHGAENGSMGFEAFAKSTGFQKYYGRTEYNQDPNYGGDADFDGTWAIYDEEFLQFYADRMSEMKQPFMTAVFTATSHPPFNLPERYKGRFPQSEQPLQECIAYSDNALRLFFEKAGKQPWFKNTIFVITSDHISSPRDAFYESILGHYCVPIIFYAPGMPELKGYDEETVVEQADIMPTIMGLLNYDLPYVAFGQDILNTPKEDKTALHWVPEFQGYEFVKGNYAMRFDGQNVTAVYDYRNDLLQKKNIAASMPKTVREQMEKEMKAEIQQYMRCMNGNMLTVSGYLNRRTTSE